MKTRLSLMNFLEFAVWGAYLTCMGNYLGVAGLGDKISWFYAIQGIVSLFMPTLMGIVADKYIQPQRLLGLCHLLAGGFMLGCWGMGLEAGFGNELTDKTAFIALYTLSVAFFMPTIALANTTAFTILKVWEDGAFSMTLAGNAHKFQYTYMQFFVSGVLSLVLCLYCFLCLPQCKLDKKETNVSLAESLGLNAFRLFKTRQMALFFIFSALLGMCLQVTNGFAGPFLTSFKASSDPAIADSFAADNATLLTSISQISEALCILMIPFFLKRYGIKVVMLMSMFAWVFRFGFFGIGLPTMPGVIMFILSCIVYGVAFDFFNVSGGIFVDQVCEPSVKASAQGLFMMMTNGVGATIGTLAAGEIVNHFCQWENGYLVGDWTTSWYIFAAFALIVAVSFALVFHPEQSSSKS